MNNPTPLALEWAEGRFASGWRPSKLLSRENVKLKKSLKRDWKGLGLSLAPAATSGYDMCASKSPECENFCIFQAGRGLPYLVNSSGLQMNWAGRIFRTLWFMRDRDSFMEKLVREIANNQDAAIRLNVFSDWIWERQKVTVSDEIASRYGIVAGEYKNLMEVFPETQFYDYTKHYKRMARPRPSNYHLTFSLTEVNAHQARTVLDAGFNVAAVMRDPTGTLFGYDVIDGDEHDLRFLDPNPVVIGLHPKGALTKEESPFVYSSDQDCAAAKQLAA